MRKIKFLAFSLMVALMLMGAGYAYWTDTLTVTGTVNTGKFDVNFEGTPTVTFVTGSSNPATPGNEYAWDGYKVGAVANGSVTYPDENTAQISLNNLYPGVEGEIKLIVNNKGTIPAKFNYATVTVNSGSELANYLNVKGYIRHKSESAPIEWFSGNQNTWFEFYEGTNNLEHQFNSNGSLEGDILEPGPNGDGDNLYIYIPFQLDPALTNLQESQMTFTIQLNWEQFNTNSNSHEN